MSKPHQIVRANTADEALQKCDIKAGDLAKVVAMNLFFNSDGSWSLFPEIERWDQDSEAARLRASIAHHRDQKADDRCWLDDQELYAVLGDGNLGDNRVGDQCAMLENCRRFIERRTAGGEWKSYAELESEVARLKRGDFTPVEFHVLQEKLRERLSIHAVQPD